MMTRALILTLFCSPATAGIFAHAVTADGRTLNLHDIPCTVASWQVELLSPEGKFMFRGCWELMQNFPDAIHIRWDDKDENIVPKRFFKPGPKGSV